MSAKDETFSDGRLPADVAHDPLCVVTRLHFANRLDALRAIVRFMRLRKRVKREIEGLIDAQVWISSRQTLFLSVWRDEQSLIEFTTLEAHVNAVRWSIDARASGWSGVFRFIGTSSMSRDAAGGYRTWRPVSLGEAEPVRVPVGLDE